MAKKLYFLLLLCLPVIASGQTVNEITVQVNKPGATVQPTMWGLFFEDINFAADGGIYAELVKNRSFEFDDPLMGWKKVPKTTANGRITILKNENSDNAHYIRIEADNAEAQIGLVNEGFRGMGVNAGATYNFSVLARNIGNTNPILQVELLGSKGNTLGKTKIENISGGWKKYTASFQSSETDAKASLSVVMEGQGVLELDMISLFPQDTWKNRPNGLRKDIVQLLADMKPGFMRFPGGCIVEGRNLNNRYQWKKTIGEPAERKLILNRWNNEFKHRLTPDYYQSYGLGFFEYFLLAEDIGASPLPIMNCGMACQFNTSVLLPLENLYPYIQDIFDLIEFANGPATSKWGELRSKMGHPEPFNLKMIGIGNEQWGPQYIDRYKVFAKAIKAKYPNITLVSGAGPDPNGELFDFAWNKLRGLQADIIDEHYYRAPEWFLQNASRYNNYDRKGPKVFAGEYAAQSVAICSPDNKNNWKCAMSEAAFMTGLERNAGVVYMASYAPLFAHTEAWQWTPNLIWFDNLNSYGTPNYYMQKMFATNKGNFVVPALKNGMVIDGKDSLYCSATINKNPNEIIIKMVNIASKPTDVKILPEGVKSIDNDAILQVLASKDLNIVNSIANPKAIAPGETKVKLNGKQVKISLDAYSFSVLKINFRE